MVDWSTVLVPHTLLLEIVARRNQTCLDLFLLMRLVLKR